MSNPWLQIPLSDYESHMSLPDVAQAEMLVSELVTAMDEFAPASVAVIGCAGGNGFDRMPHSVKRVVGVDVNPDYIAVAAARYQGRIAGAEFHVADIQVAPLPFAPVDLLFAALVFEYVELSSALHNLARACHPDGHLVALLQQPSTGIRAVSPSPYTSVQMLAPIMRLVAPAELRASAASAGFVLETERTIKLKSGKEFVVQGYGRVAG